MGTLLGCCIRVDTVLVWIILYSHCLVRGACFHFWCMFSTVATQWVTVVCMLGYCSMHDFLQSVYMFLDLVIFHFWTSKFLGLLWGYCKGLKGLTCSGLL